MNRISGYVIIVLVVLVAGVLIAGCTDSAPSDKAPAQTPAVTATPSTTALYTAGDIVRSPKAGADTGYLILRYDSGTDSYERAFIYRNSDGSWGYRADARTETLGRSVLEKVNTVRVTHVDPSAVSVKGPAVTSAPVTAATTSSGTGTSPAQTVTASATLAKLRITGIAPDKGMAGTSVLVTDILGDGFLGVTTIMLVRSSSPNISATNIIVLSSSHMSCTIPLPADATVGIWDLMVINKDGQSTRYSNGFTIRANANPTATTTTPTTGGITITSIDPVSAYSGDYKAITVRGANFKDGITCKLARSGYTDIIAATTSRLSETQMQC
ncbi:MAG: hypothetical protein Q8R70_05565, partial [Methanoregula sp.]|nr:hypothetical protein [Methanoregula sp.]